MTVADLSRISPLVGRTLAGRAEAEGTLAGTATDPTVAATVKASSVKVDTVFEALSVDGTLDGRIPGRDVSAFTGSLKTNSTLVTVAGRQIPALMVAVDRAGDELQFQAEAREAGRAVGGEGQVTLFPTYRDVRVNRLTLEAGPGRWVLPEGSPMLARYDDSGLVTFSNGFTLVNGMQSVAAQGTLSLSPDVPGQLTVRGIGVELGGIGDLLLIERQLGGLLDTAAEIGGTSQARTIAAQFAVSNGLVGEYQFDSLQAKVDYASSRAAVDARLIQSPGSQLDLHGLVPVSIERGELTDDKLQVDLTSAGIDLAVLAAATDQLEAVAGRLTVDMHLTGTGLVAPRRGHRRRGAGRVHGGVHRLALHRRDDAGPPRRQRRAHRPAAHAGRRPARARGHGDAAPRGARDPGHPVHAQRRRTSRYWTTSWASWR